MWFCYHYLCCRRQGVMLTLPLCCSSCLSPRCLFRHMLTMPWVLQRLSFSFRVEPPTILSIYVVCYGLGIQLIFKHLFLILLPDSVVRLQLHSIPFFTVLRILFLIVKLAFIATLTSLWCRLGNYFPLACFSLQPV